MMQHTPKNLWKPTPDEETLIHESSRKLVSIQSSIGMYVFEMHNVSLGLLSDSRTQSLGGQPSLFQKK
jgi:hypothetical protein